MPSRAQRQLKSMLRSGKSRQPTGSRMRKFLSETTRQLTNSVNNEMLGWKDHSNVKFHWRTNLRPFVLIIRAVLLGLLLGLILLCVACAAQEPVAPPIRNCRVPEVSLAPTLVPPMTDKTNKELIKEAETLREKLVSCNSDKADALEFLLRKN